MPGKVNGLAISITNELIQDLLIQHVKSVVLINLVLTHLLY